MPIEKTPAEFEVILKQEAEKHNIPEDKLREEVWKELCARVAREIVDKIIAGEVLFPKEEPVNLVWGISKSRAERKRGQP